MPDFMNGLRRVSAVTLALAAAGSASAQQTSAATPWRAWLGCWSASVGVDAAAPLVCVSPTANANAVRITTITDGKVASAQTVDASGREVPLDAAGCSGTQIGRWSADGRRVYLSAAATCDGAPRATSGILAMTADGEWLDVQGVKAGSEEKVRVARYRDAGLRSSVPADIAEALRNGGLSVQSARVAAGSDIGTTAVVEATHATTVGVAEAFVLERGQRFQLDARQLVALADAGVSPRITDAMIAVSNPQTFAVNRPAPPSADNVIDVNTGRRVYVTMDRYESPWGWGYSPYGRYGYNSFGGYPGSGYGYSGYGYPGYIYTGPVVIVRGSEAAQPHGRMVKGRGYEQGARPAPTPDRATTRDTGSNAAASSSSGSSNAGSSAATSSGSGEQRTAKPRP